MFNQNYKQNKYILNFFIFISFIILSFISISLLLKNHIGYAEWDIQFHFKRIFELKSSIMHLQSIFPNFSFNEFHGSSVMTLYPYLNLFPIVLLSLFIKSNISLIYWSYFLNIFFMLNVSFYSCKNYTKSSMTSYIFATIYSLSSIVFFYNLLVVDFGIVYTYIFLPLIIFGMLKVIQNKNGWLELSLGMSLLFFSHILNLFIIGVFIMIYFVINLKKLNKKILFRLFYSFCLFLFITSIIWMPFVYHYIYNINNINVPYSGQLSNINLIDFFSGLYGKKSNNNIGFFPTVALIIFPFYYNKFNKYVRQLYLLSLVVISCLLFLPWKFITTLKIFAFLNQLQFVNRFLIVPMILLSFIFSLIITKYVKFKYIICLFSLFIAILLQFTMGQYALIKNNSNNPSVNEYLQSNDNNIINMDEINNYQIFTSSQFNKFLNAYYPGYDDYIPKSALSMSSYVNKNIGFYNDYHQIKVNHTGYNTFSFLTNDNINELSLPIYAYNKEKLYVYLNGNLVNNYANKSGILTINNIQDNVKSKNKIYIKEVFNPFRVVGLILSIFGWLFILWIFIKRKFIR